ncbi:flagellar protein FlaG [Shewanella indica]|uniref:flagellar protein FlaG n=1 Tax=Shewanella TaxID=22 RepID=UPI000A79F10C|nr:MULTISPECIES: flagellar protein FlaG [Shewanella]MBZ4680082.1 flagellar protein FlaG protein [Shewanella sp.]MCA0950195.1 flagellar protein FlaG [Shewanella chilikensis]GHB10204.1 flagella locus protein FlaG [Shewanella indica]
MSGEIQMAPAISVVATPATEKYDRAQQNSSSDKLAEVGTKAALNPTELAGVASAKPVEAEVDTDTLIALTDSLTDMMSMMRKGLEFRVDEMQGMPVVSVMDMDSGELIRQIPSEEALALAEKMSEIAGVLMKTEA